MNITPNKRVPAFLPFDELWLDFIFQLKQKLYCYRTSLKIAAVAQSPQVLSVISFILGCYNNHLLESYTTLSPRCEERAKKGNHSS